MASKTPLGLPPMTSELKSIAPYLQRAEEVKGQEPIIAYWCAYYAAQVGIGLKVKDPPSREVLLSLLGVLEQFKSEMGSNDAVDVDAVGAAYVENFALKVFASADNEDRAGRATKATAKKFLAAAHFMEVLKTFSQAEMSESIMEKAKYAKWKAADVAKAIREGRKPTPGPPGGTEESEDEVARELGVIAAAKVSNASGSPSPAIPSLPSVPTEYSQPAGSTMVDEGWSTIAMPGTELNASVDITDNAFEAHKRIPSGGSSKSASGRRSPQRKALAGNELEGSSRLRTFSPGIIPTKSHSPTRNSGSKPPSPPPLPRSRSNSPGSSEKKVHFTPSAVGGSTDSGSTMRISGGTPPVKTPCHPLPPSPPPMSSPSWHHTPQPPPVAPVPVPLPPTAPAVIELTPAMVSKAQRHCRFAASALDYEDVETAKKELRAALAMLGG